MADEFPTHTFFSFVKDGTYLGSCLVDEGDPVLAVSITFATKCNPGGEVFYTSFTMTDDMDMKNAPINTLLSREDLMRLGISWRKNDQES